MIEIPLTRGYTAIIDNVDADLAQYKWRADKKRNTVYAIRTIWVNRHYESIYLHRVLMERVHARKLIKGELVDHINGDGLNNTRSNLRICTAQQNLWNSRGQLRSRTGVKGVTKRKNTKTPTWQAQIKINGKQTYIGVYHTIEEARDAYQKKAQELRGEFNRAA